MYMYICIHVCIHIYWSSLFSFPVLMKQTSQMQFHHRSCDVVRWKRHRKKVPASSSCRPLEGWCWHHCTSEIQSFVIRIFLGSPQTSMATIWQLRVCKQGMTAGWCFVGIYNVLLYILDIMRWRLLVDNSGEMLWCWTFPDMSWESHRIVGFINSYPPVIKYGNGKSTTYHISDFPMKTSIEFGDSLAIFDDTRWYLFQSWGIVWQIVSLLHAAKALHVFGLFEGRGLPEVFLLGVRTSEMMKSPGSWK